MGTVQEPGLKQAVGVVLKDAADRCAFVSRDLDLARGEPLGTPTPEWSDRSGKPAMASRVRDSRTGVFAGARPVIVTLQHNISWSNPMEPKPGNDEPQTIRTQFRWPIASISSKRTTSLIRLLTERGVLPRVVEEPVPSAPGLKITSDGATLACATGAAGLALGALGH